VVQLFDQHVVDDADAAEITDLVEVDNDNDPAPENIVQPGETVANVFEPVWSHTGICYQHATNAHNISALLDFPREVKPKNNKCLSCFSQNRLLLIPSYQC
jgi:hypothetical protein